MNGHRPVRGNPIRKQNPAYGLLQPIFSYETETEGVNDQDVWQTGISRLAGWFTSLPDAVRAVLNQQLERYRRLKEAYAAACTEADASAVCSSCGGLCCLNGKYRMSVGDYISCLATGVEPAADFARKPVCPYGSNAGCAMSPGLRPADCILFICEGIEERLSREGVALLHRVEQELRDCTAEISHISGLPAGTPLLIWAEQFDTNKNQ